MVRKKDGPPEFQEKRWSGSRKNNLFLNPNPGKIDPQEKDENPWIFPDLIMKIQNSHENHEILMISAKSVHFLISAPPVNPSVGNCF